MNFFEKINMSQSRGDEPLSHVINLCRHGNTKGYKHIKDYMEYIGEPEEQNLRALHQRCLDQNNRSKTETYLKVNPNMYGGLFLPTLKKIF